MRVIQIIKVIKMGKCILIGVVLLIIFIVGCGIGKQISENKSGLTIEEAIEIAQDSECREKGRLTDSSFYNENSKTWWIELEMKPEFENKICNPACVVSEETKTAEINWRCTGLIPEE